MEPIQEPVVEPEAEPTAEPVEPAWAPSQDEWQQISDAVGHLAQLEQQRAQVYQPQPGDQNQIDIDPFGENFGEQLRGVIRQELTPYQEFQQSVAIGEAEERAMDILSDLASKDGDFDKDVARLRAEQMLPEMTAKYGPGVKAAEAALEAAAQQQRAYEQKLYEQAVAKHTNHLATLSGAPGEPGTGYTVGVSQRTMPDYREGGSVTRRFFGPDRET